MKGALTGAPGQVSREQTKLLSPVASSTNLNRHYASLPSLLTPKQTLNPRFRGLRLESGRPKKTKRNLEKKLNKE